ncbi:MAG: gliding motility-associated C-terminal domain-containing protein [Bacteroidetes bacterium]|nr:gliding motility-associated C-terminal domain-containing protein [Bacteroidota bacterium]
MVKHLLPCAKALAKSFSLFAVALISITYPSNSWAQCPSPCSPNGFNEGGVVTPISNFWQTLNVGSGTYVTSNVHNGGIYSFSHCNTTNANISDVQISGSTGSTCLFYNDDAGPICTGLKSSAQWTANFNGTINVNTNKYSCQNWIGNGAANSAVLDYRCDGPGNPAVFGNDSWILYAWNTGDANGTSGAWTNAYSGYLTFSGLSFNTATLWGATGSPSDNSVFLGCTVFNDNHSWSAKRQNFPCAVYRIDVNSHDDTYQLYVNGVLVSSHVGCCDSHTGAWTGVLTAGSTVEFRCSEGVGGSGAQVNFVDVTGTVSPGTIATSQTICTGGDPAAFTNTASPSGGAGPSVNGGSYSYEWFYLDNCTGAPNAIASSNSLTYDPPAGLTNSRCYYRVTRDACGNSNFTSTPVNVTVVPDPSVSASGNTTICVGGSANLTATPANGTGCSTVTWESSPNGTSGWTAIAPTGNSITVSPAVTTFYRALYACGTTGCNPNPAVSGNVQVTVVPDPTLSASGTTSICNGGSATLTAVASNGTGCATVNWEFFNGSGWVSAGVSGLSVSVSPTSTTDYRAVWSCAGNGCNPNPVISGNVTITVNPDPSVSASGNTSICTGGSATLTAVPVGGVSCAVVTWESSANGTSGWAATGLSGNSVSVSPTSSTFYRAVYSCPGVGCNPVPAVSGNVEITVVPDPTVTASGSTTICNGQSTNLSATPAGGLSCAVVTWEIFNGSTWQPTALSGNLVTVNPTTTTDYRAVYACAGTGCTPNPTVSNTVTVTVNQLSIPPSSINAVSPICLGTSTALTQVGGSLGAGASYQWYVGGCGLGGIIGNTASINVTPTATTTYFVRASGLCNTTTCAQFQVVVQDTSIPASSVSGTSPICIGGSSNLSVSTGQLGAGASWNWFSGSCGGTFIGSGALVTVAPTSTTTYYVRAQGICNTTNCTPFTVSVNPLPNGSINGTTSICYNSSTNLTFNFNTGTPPFNVQYTDGTNTFSLNNIYNGHTVSVSPLSTTTYTFTAIVDSFGCARNSSFTAGSVITVTPLPVINSVTPTDVLCFGGSTGTIAVSASSGTAPLSYSITGAAPYQSSSNFSGLPIGTYTISVRDAQGCLSATTPSVTIGQPALLSHSTLVEDASCQNVFDGKITVTATGGILPYSYSLNGGPTQAGNQFLGLAAGTYQIFVFDFNGCLDTSNVIINNSYAVTGSLTSQTNVSCFGGSNGAISVQLTGGTPLYNYSLNGGAFTPTATFTGLSAGTYVVTLRDSKGCTDFVSTTVTQPDQLSVVIDVVNGATCFGATDGEIFITVNGGTSPYSYLWSNGTTSQDATGLATGTWTVTITDNNGCTTTTGASVGQPLNLVVSLASAQNLSCFNDSTGRIDISVSGGIPAYQYAWSNGAVSEDLTNLHAGTYTVTVVDANLCQKVLTQVITEPALLTAGISGTNVSCNGGTGSIDLSPSGGTTPYTFLWNNGATTEDISGVTSGTYSVLITDAKGCSISRSIVITQPAALSLSISSNNVLCNGGTGGINLTVSGGAPAYSFVWSNGDVTEDPTTNIVAGTYSVTVTDNNLCTATASINIAQPSQALSISLAPVDVTCNGANNGSINLTVGGGTQPYNYLWSNGSITEDIVALGAGTFTVTVTDANGCTTTGSATINQPIVLSATISGTNVSCFGGNNGIADLSVTGGNPGYTYLWNNFATTEDLNAIAAGNYTVIVTDTKGCQTIASVSITQPSQLILSTTITNVLCNGGTGSINLTANGGAGSNTYLWSNGSVTEDIANISAGTYSLTVTDANNCTASATATVTQPAALTLSGTSGNVLCNGGNSGSVNITVGGGTSPYAYLWSNSAITEDISGLLAGIFDVTVTDGNGCSISASFTISQPSALTTSITGTAVTCNGAANGAADLFVAGGTTPYSYLWSNFASTQDISNLNGGTYFVIVTDANGCTLRDSVIITEPTGVVLSGIVTNVSCNGTNNGAIDITASGGTPTYTFLWSNGATTDDLTGLAAGVYTLTLTDGNGCTKSVSFNVTQPLQAIDITLTASDVTCSGAANGSITSLVTGGTSPYVYTWSTGAITADISGLGAGNYILTVTDGNGCTAVDSTVVSAPAALVAAITGTDVSCFGGNDGSADLSVTGGNAPYNYFWSTFEFTEDIANLTAGNYVVIVTDAKSCQTFANVTIAQPTQVTVTGTVTNVSCNGAGDGIINITANGGFGPYTYLWNDLTAAEDRNGLSGGLYVVTVTDNNGCTATASFTVVNPSAITIAGVVTNVNCNGNGNGAVDITAAGGTGAYTYSWSNGSITQDLTGLNGGTYGVVVEDVNFCSATASFVVSEPAALVSSIAPTNVSCAGANDGDIDLTVTGGIAPYTYLWNTFQTVQDISNLSGGQYFVLITDANGCSKTDSVTIQEPTQLQLSISASSILCNGATANVNLVANGGTAGYSYLWSNGAVTQNISGVASGTYSVTVTDANGCSATAGITVSQPAALALNATPTQVGCNGGANGAVDITVQGGVFPYSFAWSNNATTEDINGLSGGNYTVTVTDANACTITASFTITEPSAITSSIAGTNVTCNGASNGAADLSVSGGTTPYTYLWSTFQSIEDLSNIGGGLYYVIITDANGCEKRDSILITEPAAITLSTAITNVSCNNGNNGAIDITVNGGTPTITYLWSNGAVTQDVSGLAAGTYSVTVTDGNGCTATASATITQPAGLVLNATPTQVGCNGGANGAVDITVQGGVFPYSFAWSNSDTTEDISGLSGGTYTVTVTDANACTITASFTITEPSAITSSIAGTNVTCNGASNGAADLSVSGGTTPYTYLWSTFQSIEDLSNIGGGLYYVIITDANGCEKRDSILITEPAALVLSQTITNVNCNGGSTGSIDLSVTGGVTTYSYLWSNGSTSQDLSGLVAGTYTVTVTDANACTATSTATITQPNALTLNGNTTNVSCNGGSNGAINVSVTGGVFPYTYLWSNTSTNEDQSGLVQGTYTVTATDANACTITATFTLTQPAALTSSVVAVDVTCHGANNGSADLSISGGVAPYTFSWSNFQVSEDLANLDGGVYFVSITDANGCVRRDSAIIAEPTLLQLSVAVTNVACSGSNTGAVDLTVSGGTPGYSYSWSNGAISQDLSSVGAGTYVVTVTDGNNCTATVSAIITQPNGLLASGNKNDVLCAGGNDGIINLSVSGGVTPYTFAWSNSATTEDLNGLLAGIYTVTVTDNNLCTTTASFTITEPSAIVSGVTGTNVLCYNANNGAADLTVSGGVAPYSFFWSNFQGSEDLANLDGGIYYVVITDANGCTKRDSVIIQEPTQLVLSTLNTNISCFNANNGSIDLTVAGGTAGYTYLWSNGATTEDLNNLPGGTYVVTVTDFNNCTAVTSSIIVNPSELTTNFVIGTPLCWSDANGSIDLIPTGGTPSYTYLWSNGAITEDINNLVAGVYTVTLTDVKGCKDTTIITVTEPDPLVTSGFITNVSCFNSGNGFIDITAYGGTLPYEYLWSPGGQSTEDIGGLSGGTYVVTVTDFNNCSVASLYTVLEPSALSLNLVATNVSCNGGTNATITALPGGGTTPYQYLWDDFTSDSVRTGLGAGYYVLQIIDSNGCVIFDSVAITEPAPITLSGTITNALCFGDSTGAIDINVAGGAGNYGYAWNSGDVSEDITGKPAGTYTVGVTDANFCLVSASFTIQQPTKINLQILTDQPGCFGSNNGSASVIATNGNAPYTFAWNTSPVQTTNTAGNLAAGTYLITVTDASSCAVVDSVTLSQPSAITVTTTTQGAKCFNTSSGLVALSVAGGQAPYIYELNGTIQSSDTFVGLLPGNYIAVVSDINGCEGSTSFTIAQAAQISVSLSTTQQVLLTGMSTQLIANATSTSPVVNIFWTPDSLVDYTLCADPQNCSSPYVSPPSSTIFTVTVMNSDSCYASDTISIFVNNEASKFIPTAFTPNGDGLNDRFEFDALGAKNLEVSIFNRWGERIYYNPSQTNGISGSNGWDGTKDGVKVPADTYVYSILITYFDGTTKEVEGTVTLMN